MTGSFCDEDVIYQKALEVHCLGLFRDDLAVENFAYELLLLFVLLSEQFLLASDHFLPHVHPPARRLVYYDVDPRLDKG